MARVKQNVLPIFTLKIGAGSAVNLAQDLKAVDVSNEDKDDSDLTFAELAEGTGVDWFLDLSAKISFGESGSLHDFLWTNAGAEAVMVYAPAGNATPSDTQPHFTATVRIPRKPGLALEANATAEAVFDYQLVGVGDMDKVISA